MFPVESPHCVPAPRTIAALLRPRAPAHALLSGRAVKASPALLRASRMPSSHRATRLGALLFLLGTSPSPPAAASAARRGEPIGQAPPQAIFGNDQASFDYFVGKGLTPFQAAGIVGNLDQESGVNPTAVQSGGPGRGVAQWSVGGRWDTSAGDNENAFVGAVQDLGPDRRSSTSSGTSSRPSPATASPT